MNTTTTKSTSPLRPSTTPMIEKIGPDCGVDIEDLLTTTKTPQSVQDFLDKSLEMAKTRLAEVVSRAPQTRAASYGFWERVSLVSDCEFGSIETYLKYSQPRGKAQPIVATFHICVNEHGHDDDGYATNYSRSFPTIQLPI